MAIGGTRIKFFKSSPPPGDRRPKYQISSRRERDLKDLLALSECKRERDLKDLLALTECMRERDLKDLLALSERRREQITKPLCVSKSRQVESPQCIRGRRRCNPWAS